LAEILDVGASCGEALRTNFCRASNAALANDGAVVTTPKMAATFAQRTPFNIFGGNPVVCAQGMAVLEMIEREKLRENGLKIDLSPGTGLAPPFIFVRSKMG